MLRFELGEFPFQLPPDWLHKSGDGPAVFHGQAGEELLITFTALAGAGAMMERELILQRLIENAIKSARDAASHPDLI